MGNTDVKTFVFAMLGCLVAGCLAAHPTFAADNSRGEALADACTGCHGIEGQNQGYIPSLNTLTRAQLIQAMAEFREQKRVATVMDRIARAYTAAEVELIADYFTADAKR